MSQSEIVKAEVSKEINGIEMGVMTGGTPFLSMRSLSKLCGVANSSLSVTSAEWIAGKRDTRLSRFLATHPHAKLKSRGNLRVAARSTSVCSTTNAEDPGVPKRPRGRE